MNKYPAVYILANKRNGTLYTGVTSDLVKRIYQQYEKLISFAQYYECKYLVYYEQHQLCCLQSLEKSK